MMNEDRMNRKSKCRIDIVIQFTLTFNGTSSSIAFKLTAIASIPRDEIYALWVQISDIWVYIAIFVSEWGFELE